MTVMILVLALVANASTPLSPTVDVIVVIGIKKLHA